MPTRSGPVTLAIVTLLIGTPPSACAGASSVDQWVQSVSEGFQVIDTATWHLAVVHARVTEVHNASRIGWDYPISDVDLEIIETITGAVPENASFFTMAAIWFDDDGEIYTKGREGFAAERWVAPGDEILALLVSPRPGLDSDALWSQRPHQYMISRVLYLENDKVYQLTSISIPDGLKDRYSQETIRDLEFGSLDREMQVDGRGLASILRDLQSIQRE